MTVVAPTNTIQEFANQEFAVLIAPIKQNTGGNRALSFTENIKIPKRSRCAGALTNEVNDHYSDFLVEYEPSSLKGVRNPSPKGIVMSSSVVKRVTSADNVGVKWSRQALKWYSLNHL